MILRNLKKEVPNAHCEAGWFWMASTNLCYYVDHYHLAGWDAARTNCLGLGANFASINSPLAQDEIIFHLNDPDAIGNQTFFLKFVNCSKIARVRMRVQANRVVLSTDTGQCNIFSTCIMIKSTALMEMVDDATNEFKEEPYDKFIYVISCRITFLKHKKHGISITKVIDKRDE